MVLSAYGRLRRLNIPISLSPDLVPHHSTWWPVKWYDLLLYIFWADAHVRVILQSAQEILECLVKHGCTDLSLRIDNNRYSASAIASGGFGDVWQAWLKSDILVAVKCLRLHVILEGDEKGMKVSVHYFILFLSRNHSHLERTMVAYGARAS